jgi:hypothetical protein
VDKELSQEDRIVSFYCLSTEYLYNLIVGSPKLLMLKVRKKKREITIHGKSQKIHGADLHEKNQRAVIYINLMFL